MQFSLEEIEEIVKEDLMPHLDKYTIFAFTGPLGAGKTTIIKEFFRQAGVEEVVTSPTFTYVKHYTSQDGKMFNHFDLYRLSKIDSFLALGFDEYLYDENSWSVIEWPEVINDLLQGSAISRRVLHVKLDYVEGDLEKRSLETHKLT